MAEERLTLKAKNLRIGVAFGGGGARGAAHIGVLRVLEREGIPIHVVAGTSIGGLVALCYASGKTADEIFALLTELDTRQLRLDTGRAGLLSLERLRPLLESVFGERTFADLQLPCAVVAVDLDHGEEVVIREGRLVDALLATGAVPGLFPPVRMLGLTLVDGGILNPIPVAVARDLGADKVIAVNICGNRALPYTQLTGVGALQAFSKVPVLELVPWREALQIYGKAHTITTVELAERRLQVEKPDVVIRPPVGDVGLLDTETLVAVAAAGEAATLAVLPQLHALLDPPKRFWWR